jgi:hypothetical protein
VLIVAITGLLTVAGGAALALGSGLAALQDGTSALNSGEFARAEERLGSARKRLAIAASILDPASASLGWAGSPGDNLALASEVADAALPLAAGGGHAASAALDLSRGGLTRSVGSRLDQAAAQLRASADRLDAGGDSPGLAPLTAAQMRLRQAARPLTLRVSVAALLASLARSSERYLLVIQNPAELRATGGLVGAWGTLEGGAEGLRLTRLATDVELPPGDRAVRAPSDFVARYGRFGATRTWANANMSADFPTSAGVLLSLYAQRAGRRLDGVVAIDARGLSYLLEAVGPVRSGPETLTGGRFVSQALVEAYERSPRRRGELLIAAARAGWRALSERGQAFELGRAVGTAAADGHLRVYARRGPLQRKAIAAGVAGRLERPAGDYLQLVRQNAGANKLDYYASVSLRYDVRLRRDGSADATLTSRIGNRAQPAALPAYVIGPRFGGAPPGLARSWVSAYSPLGSTLSGFAGPEGRTAESAEELGHAVHSWFHPVGPGRRASARLRLRLPQVVDAQGRYHLLVQRQPSLQLERLTVTVDGRKVFDGRLARDVRLSAVQGS